MKKASLCLFATLFWFIPCETWAYTSKDCMGCHSEGSKESVLHISIGEFQRSIHGRDMTCMDCHTGIEDDEHTRSKGAGAVDCGECHEQENRHGSPSTSENLPRCHSCHTRHGILGKDDRVSTVHPEKLKQTCKGCHPLECGEFDYFSWLPSIRIMSHKKQDFSQAYRKENCLGCHQGQAAHGEKETLNEQNCHICHMSVKDQGALMGYIHPKADYRKQPIVFAAATLYQIFIVLLLWGGCRLYIPKLSRILKKRRK